MNTDQMAYLIDIAKTGSINTTAKRLFSSQQAISESIKRLENELNCTLLIRSKKGVTLTEDGKYVLKQITAMYEQYEDLQYYFNLRHNTLNGSLKIGVAPLATAIFLPDLLFNIYRNYPDVTLYTQELSIEEIFQQILQKELDFGIVGLSDQSEYQLENSQETYKDTLFLQPLFEDEICCVMHKHHPYAAYKTITDEQINQTKLTCYSLPTANNMSTYLHISNNTAIHQKFMKEEHTVAILPYQLFKQLYSPKEFLAIPLQNKISCTTTLVYSLADIYEENMLFQTFIDTAIDLARKI